MIERAPPVPPVSAPQPRRRRFLLFLGIFLSALVALPVTLLVVSDVVMLANGWTAYGQPGGSMQPTLQQNDAVIVETAAYRDGRRPDYGDVVVVNLPGRWFSGGRSPSDVPLAKRVVGKPGDRVEVRNGQVSVNGHPLPQERLGVYAPGKVRWRERASNGVTYDILRTAEARSQAEGDGAWTVPTGCYFLMGDNRDDSRDSRSWAREYGRCASDRAIVGRAYMVYFSGFDRLDRIGTVVK